MSSVIKELFNQDLLLAPIIALPPLLVAIIIWYVLLSRRSKTLLAGIVHSQGSTPWRAVSGKELWYYVILDDFMAVPAYAEILGEWFRGIIRQARGQIGRIDRLAFIEKKAGPVGMLTAKDFLTVKSGIPSVAVRPRRRLPNARITGLKEFPIAGQNVVVISDIATTGGTIMEAVDILESQGATVRLVVVFYDREEGASEQLAKRGIVLKSMMNPTEVSKWPELEKKLRELREKKALVA